MPTLVVHFLSLGNNNIKILKNKLIKFIYFFIYFYCSHPLCEIYQKKLLYQRSRLILPDRLLGYSCWRCSPSCPRHYFAQQAAPVWKPQSSGCNSCRKCTDPKRIILKHYKTKPRYTLCKLCSLGFRC
jgi:hypothetical protein